MQPQQQAPVNIDPQGVMNMVRNLSKNRQDNQKVTPEAFQALLNAQLQQGVA
jgi:hypothetical protein